MKTDKELIELFQNGDNSAITVLLKRYEQDLRRYLLSLVGNETDAQDIFQDTVVRIIVSLRKGKYQESTKFKSWALTIARNFSMDYHRLRSKIKFIPIEEVEDLREPHTDYSENSEEIKVLHKAINHLPEKQKDIIIQYYFNNERFSEISQKNEESINSSLGRMRYARQNLKKMILPLI
jgi:RNA polymerase sigma factor (sigma-70 family)